MSKVLIATFNDRTMASEAIDDLKRFGYAPEFMNMDTRTQEPKTFAPVIGNRAGRGLLTGALTGGIAGFLVGTGVITNMRTLLYGGILASNLGLTGIQATALTGTVTGVILGALIGAIVGLAIPKRDLLGRDTMTLRGDDRFMVAVPLLGSGAQASTVMQEAGAVALQELRLADLHAAPTPVAEHVPEPQYTPAPTFPARNYVFGERIMDVHKKDQSREE